MNPARLAIPFAVLILAATAAGCSRGTSSGNKTATAGAGGAANPTAAATKAASGSPASGGATKQVTITAKDFSFKADDVTVAKGDTVNITFKNTGATTHTLAFYTDSAYTDPIAGADTGNVAAGATRTLTVQAGAGLYYRCNIHPTQMQGEIELN